MGFFIYNDTILNPKISKLNIQIKIKNKPYIFDFLNGPIFINQTSRKNTDEYMNKVIAKIDSLKENSVIICGTFEPILRQKIGILQGNKIKFYIDNKYKIYYLEGQNNFNKDVYKIDLDKLGATLL